MQRQLAKVLAALELHAWIRTNNEEGILCLRMNNREMASQVLRCHDVIGTTLKENNRAQIPFCVNNNMKSFIYQTSD